MQKKKTKFLWTRRLESLCKKCSTGQMRLETSTRYEKETGNRTKSVHNLMSSSWFRYCFARLKYKREKINLSPRDFEFQCSRRCGERLKNRHKKFSFATSELASSSHNENRQKISLIPKINLTEFAIVLLSN